jgi:hypothetical protein
MFPSFFVQLTLQRSAVSKSTRPNRKSLSPDAQKLPNTDRIEAGAACHFAPRAEDMSTATGMDHPRRLWTG